MTIDEIIYAFHYIEKNTFPLEALNEAIAKQEEITPVLLAYIQKSPSEVDAIYLEKESKQTTSFMWEFSLYLLAQFREKKAYPLIIKFFSDEDQERVKSVASAFTTESLPSVLASTFNGDIEALFAAIEDSNINSFIRSSFLKATIILIFHSILKLDDLRPKYIKLFNHYIETSNWDQITYLVRETAHLADPLLRPYINKAFEEDLVEIFRVNKNDIERLYANPLKKDNYFYTLITDTHAEMRSWPWFGEKRLAMPSGNPSKFKNKSNISYTAADAPQQFIRNSPKVGRNAPCPCGSGKKHKKCCLNQTI